MKTRSIILIMVALALCVLGGAVALDQVKTRNHEIDVLRRRVEDEKKLKKLSDFIAKSDARLEGLSRDTKELQHALAEIDDLKNRLAEIQARKPQTVEGQIQKEEDLKDFRRRAELAKRRLQAP